MQVRLRLRPTCRVVASAPAPILERRRRGVPALRLRSAPAIRLVVLALPVVLALWPIRPRRAAPFGPQGQLDKQGKQGHSRRSAAVRRAVCSVVLALRPICRRRALLGSRAPLGAASSAVCSVVHPLRAARAPEHLFHRRSLAARVASEVAPTQQTSFPWAEGLPVERKRRFLGLAAFSAPEVASMQQTSGPWRLGAKLVEMRRARPASEAPARRRWSDGLPAARRASERLFRVQSPAAFSASEVAPARRL